MLKPGKKSKLSVVWTKYLTALITLVTCSCNPFTKKRKALNRKAAKCTKFKTPSRGIVQNRDTVLDTVAFSFAASRQMKKHQTLRFFPGDL
jgi:hypothetical protein